MTAVTESGGEILDNVINHTNHNISTDSGMVINSGHNDDDRSNLNVFSTVPETVVEINAAGTLQNAVGGTEGQGITSAGTAVGGTTSAGHTVANSAEILAQVSVNSICRQWFVDGYHMSRGD